MDTSTPQGSSDGVDPDEADDSSASRNTLSGSASAAVQARNIGGDVTQNHYSPGGWGWTVILVCLLSVAGTLLVVVINDTPSEQLKAEDASVPLVAAINPITDPCSSDWFTSRTAEEVRALVPDGEPRSWTDLGNLTDGASADNGKVMVTLQGRNADRSVMITGIAIEVLSRNPPPVGTVLDAPCGGPDNYRYVDINLDDPAPKAVGRPVSADAVEEARKSGWRVDPIVFPYEVTSTDAETFLLSASTALCDCTWTVHFDWASGGQTGRLTVPADGESFRVVSSSDATRCSTLKEVGCR